MSAKAVLAFLGATILILVAVLIGVVATRGSSSTEEVAAAPPTIAPSPPPVAPPPARDPAPPPADPIVTTITIHQADDGDGDGDQDICETTHVPIRQSHLRIEKELAAEEGSLLTDDEALDRVIEGRSRGTGVRERPCSEDRRTVWAECTVSGDGWTRHSYHWDVVSSLLFEGDEFDCVRSNGTWTPRFDLSSSEVKRALEQPANDARLQEYARRCDRFASGRWPRTLSPPRHCQVLLELFD